MKDCYKYVYGKICVIDDKEGLLEYDYQDNIDEVLKQENVIEELNNTISRLKDKREFIDSIKNNFYYMFFYDEEYGFVNILYLLMLAFVIGMGGEFLTEMFGLEVNSIVFSIGSIVSLVSMIPSTLINYKKFKNSNTLKLINIDEQLDEFEEKLGNEKQKLKELEKNKSVSNVDNIIKESKIYICNDTIKSLTELEKRKCLYSLYRENCLKIKRMIKKGNLDKKIDDILSDNDMLDLVEMSDNANNVLVRKKEK